MFAIAAVMAGCGLNLPTAAPATPAESSALLTPSQPEARFGPQSAAIADVLILKVQTVRNPGRRGFELAAFAIVGGAREPVGVVSPYPPDQTSTYVLRLPTSVARHDEAVTLLIQLEGSGGGSVAADISVGIAVSIGPAPQALGASRAVAAKGP